MIPAPRLRSGSPRLSLGLGGAGEQLRTPSGRTAAGSGSSKRARGLGLNLGGFFQRSGHSWCSAPVQAVGAGAGFGIWAALRYGAVPIPSAEVSIKSHSGGVFFLVFCFSMAFSLGCRGVLGIAERVFTQPRRRRALWRCAALSPWWPEGQGGTRRWHRLPPPPPAWERSHLSCQHRPLGRRADVCVLLHVGVRASLPLPRADAAPS